MKKFFCLKIIRKTRLTLRVLSCALLIFAKPVFSIDKGDEYKIKTAYLYNFTKFITWPENRLSTFNICILGYDPFGVFIDPIKSKTVHNKPIKIHHLQTISEAGHCQIMYFDGNQAQWRSSLSSPVNVLTIASQNDQLTVGKSGTYSQPGMMITFVVKEGKIKLQINLRAVKQGQLQISAQLLEVAEIIANDLEVADTVKGDSDD